MIKTEAEAQEYIAERWGKRALQNCAALIEALRQESERQNLVSRSSLQEVWVRHIADSAQLLHHAPLNWRSWIDVGTGAGFPGLVIALLQRDCSVTLVEPRRLRVQWLKAMRDRLELANCRIFLAKAEEMAAEPHQVVSARAVASLHYLLQITDKFALTGTRWLFAKGRNAEAELQSLPPQLARRYAFHVEQSLTAIEARIIVCERTRD